jgi:beta-glucosidase
VLEAGIYQCNAYGCYDRNSQAQSSCSISINHIFSMTLSVHGTEGKMIKVEGLKVQLEKGYYDVHMNFVKPGLELERLEMIKD